MDYDKANKILFFVILLILFIFGIYANVIGSSYKYDFIILIIFISFVYVVRKRIELHPIHFFLFGIFLIIHNLGIFGFYSKEIIGIEFDWYLHGFFGFVASLIIARSYHILGPHKGWYKHVAVLMMILGFSVMHELFEYFGFLLFGPGEGVLLLGAGDLDLFDSQKDMLLNLIGGIIGIISYSIKIKKRL
jgi:uncharacterized membrane protein YjdF